MSHLAPCRLALAATAAVLAFVAPTAAQTIQNVVQSEQFFTGTLLSGDYQSTQADDGACEVFEEVVYRAKYSAFEHLYSLDLPASAIAHANEPKRAVAAIQTRYSPSIAHARSGH